MPLHLQIFIALIVGILLAAGLTYVEPATKALTLDISRVIGNLFLNALKAVALPLVVVTLIAGIGNLNQRLGRLGALAISRFRFRGRASFVLALLLLVGPSWQILKSVSAFTVAHSITLAFAALGVIRFPSAVIETLVALSIVFVACELLPRPGREDTLTRRYPWVIAFVFGLLHGFAFAGALAQIGLPQGAAPQALLLFNVGVEIGQLIFIAGAVGVIVALKTLSGRLPDRALAVARATPAYVIGACATYWFIERLVAAVA